MKVTTAAALPLPEHKPAPPSGAAVGTGAVGGSDSFSTALAQAPGVPERKPDAPPLTAGGVPLPGRKPTTSTAEAVPLPGRKPEMQGSAVAILPQRKPEVPGTETAALPQQKPATVPAQPQQETSVAAAVPVPVPGRKPAPPAEKSAVTVAAAAATEQQAGSVKPMTRNEMARQIIQASQVAAGPSGHSFKTLVAQASQESEFNINKKSKLSSAAGPFQFLQGTWLDMFRRYGAAYGLGDLASKIQVKDGKAVVADPEARKQILELRHDVDIAAGMAARMLSEGRAKLESRLGRPIDENESRLAYIFGVGGAMTLLRAMDRDPNTPAAQLLPGAAKVNGPLFYDRKSGEPLSVKDALARMTRRLNVDHAAMFQAISQAVPPPSQLDGGPSPFNPFQTATDLGAGSAGADNPSGLMRDDNAVATERRPV